MLALPPGRVHALTVCLVLRTYVAACVVLRALYTLQSYKAGWSTTTPNGNVLISELRMGIPFEFNLPSMSLSSQNMLRIVVDPNQVKDSSGVVPQRAIYVSYR